MRKLTLRGVYIPFLNPHSCQGTTSELALACLIPLILERSRTLRAQDAILPAEKADPSVQLWFSNCKHAVSCLSYEIHQLLRTHSVLSLSPNALGCIFLQAGRDHALTPPSDRWFIKQHQALLSLQPSHNRLQWMPWAREVATDSRLALCRERGKWGWGIVFASDGNCRG